MIKVMASWQATFVFIFWASMNVTTSSLDSPDSVFLPQVNIGVLASLVFVMSAMIIYPTVIVDKMFWKYIESIGDKNRFTRRKKCIVVHGIHYMWVFTNMYMIGFVCETGVDMPLNRKIALSLLWTMFVISQSLVRQKLRNDEKK